MAIIMFWKLQMQWLSPLSPAPVRNTKNEVNVKSDLLLYLLIKRKINK